MASTSEILTITEKHSPLEQFEISPYAHFETGIGDLSIYKFLSIDGYYSFGHNFIFNTSQLIQDQFIPITHATYVRNEL